MTIGMKWVSHCLLAGADVVLASLGAVAAGTLIAIEGIGYCCALVAQSN